MKCSYLREAAEWLEKVLLPIFNSWSSQKDVQKTILENGMLIYLREISKIRKISTIWSTSVDVALNVKNNGDISNFPKLLVFLKFNPGYTSKKSRTFSGEKIAEILENAPDDRYAT